MKYLTFTNFGCTELCHNMITSLMEMGVPPGNILVATLDKESENTLADWGVKVLPYTHQPIKHYANWTFDANSEFRQIVKHKWKIIQQVYETNKELVWVDTDIVFLKNIEEDIRQTDGDFLFQVDHPGMYVCTGFMVFRDNPTCQKIIDHCASCDDCDDQLVIQDVIKGPVDARPLSRFKYPNGHFIHQEKMTNTDRAYIVHNNYMIGAETKANKFKEMGLWYL